MAAAAEDLSVTVDDAPEAQPRDNAAYRALMAEFSSRPSGGEAFYPTKKGIEMTYANKDVKVTGRETIMVSGHDIDCYIVESTVSVTALGLNVHSLEF